jgi:hypothetical protein
LDWIGWWLLDGRCLVVNLFAYLPVYFIYLLSRVLFVWVGVYKRGMDEGKGKVTSLNYLGCWWHETGQSWDIDLSQLRLWDILVSGSLHALICSGSSYSAPATAAHSSLPRFKRLTNSYACPLSALPAIIRPHCKPLKKFNPSKMSRVH